MKDFEEIKQAFELMDDWEERYQLIIDLGKQLPPMPDELKTPETKVEGCTSQVWMTGGSGEDNSFHFQADSDAHIVRGLIALLMSAYEGKSAEYIHDFNIEKEFQELGLEKHISPNRRNGFYAMVNRIHQLA